jgi:enamine deaminase RidA (YjgF/YER057c/UK114 family)
VLPRVRWLADDFRISRPGRSKDPQHQPPPPILTGGFFYRRMGHPHMSQPSILAHNPAAVWQVPDRFSSIYSHAVEVKAPGRFLFVSGQFGVAPDGTLAPDFAAQCEQAMDNVEALLAAAGMTIASVAKLIYYVTSPADFAALLERRQRRWALDPAPSVTALVVAGLARPEYLIEIEAIAVAA